MTSRKRTSYDRWSTQLCPYLWTLFTSTGSTLSLCDFLPDFLLWFINFQSKMSIKLVCKCRFPSAVCLFCVVKETLQCSETLDRIISTPVKVSIFITITAVHQNPSNVKCMWMIFGLYWFKRTVHINPVFGFGKQSLDYMRNSDLDS